MFIQVHNCTMKKRSSSYLSFQLPPLPDIHLLPRLRDPPRRAKSHYHQPFFISTMMFRHISINQGQRGRVGESKATKRSDLRIHKRGHQVDHKSPSYLCEMKDLFSLASKHNYAYSQRIIQ